MSSPNADRNFPFLRTIASELTKNAEEADPLFYPGLDFSFSGYHSICDFTFMKSVDAMGVERFLWIIYDNSTHYRLVIKNEMSGKMKFRNQEVTSTTFLKAG